MRIKLLVPFAVMSSFLALATMHAATMTLTGEVGDSMCGVKHKMQDAAACTAACVAKGADYALIVKDKAYTLKATAAQKAELAKMAGKMAMVTGNVNGDTIAVAKLMMAKSK